MEQKTKKREWVKTAAIVFLSVLLVLTFFSNTIMNRSLPEVATASVQSGSINAQIRGSGTISANETYDVVISQARVVQSVLARVGDTVQTGDTLFILDPAESQELQSARETLASMELSYQEQLINASNTAATEDRELQKLKEAYNEALALYKQYTSVDADELVTRQSAAEAELKALNRALKDAQEALSDAETNESYMELRGEVESTKAKITALESEIEGYQEQLSALGEDRDERIAEMQGKVNQARAVWQTAVESYARDRLVYQSDYELLYWFSKNLATNTDVQPSYIGVQEGIQELLQQDVHASVVPLVDSWAAKDSVGYSAPAIKRHMAAGAMDSNYIMDNGETWLRLLLGLPIEAPETAEDPSDPVEEPAPGTGTGIPTVTSDPVAEKVAAMGRAYNVITADEAAMQTALAEYQNLYAQLVDLQNGTPSVDAAKLNQKITDAQYEIRELNWNYAELQRYLSSWEAHIEALEEGAEQAQEAVEAQQELLDTYTDALGAADRLKSAQEALEDRTFQLSLGDASNLHLQEAKQKIDKQKERIAELEKNADALEVKAKVSGILSAVNITAGNTAAPDTALATITINDRGYTVQISVTNEQAQRVRIGDQATISNYYYGNVTAVLERIASDPQNRSGKMLIFRMTGDGVEAGANVTLAIGQRSANYDALVPNSAIRTDSNGSFVLVVTTKNSPLSNRYFARRVDVQVLGSDDTHTAVSGISAGDFVVTTSTRPIEAGDQIRLVDEQ